MTNIKVLLIEDGESDIETMVSTVERYNDEKQINISLTIAKTTEDALVQFEQNHDAAIVDLTIGDDQRAGDGLMMHIRSNDLRMPCIIFTGTPDTIDDRAGAISKKTKGTDEIYEILNDIVGLHRSGITKVLGKFGRLDAVIAKIYTESILPQWRQWSAHALGDDSKTEDGLFRHVIQHLRAEANYEDPQVFPMEVYLMPCRSREISTGTIWRSGNGDLSILLSPPCDLAIHGDTFKSDRLLMVSIQSLNSVLSGKNTKEIKKLKQNSLYDYYHYLPMIENFQGGFVNFRHAIAVEKLTHQSFYTSISTRVADDFTKDILARFAQYYSRQGQPELVSH